LIISALDSYYSYVAAQMLAISARVEVSGKQITQPMLGYVSAGDWPQTPIVEGGLALLLVRGPVPVGRGQAQVMHKYLCQWNWILIGQDIQSANQSANRGDRFRANMQVMENLRQANYPCFAQKRDYSCDGTSLTNVPSSSAYPYSPEESVRWTNPQFIPHFDDDKSGVVYGRAVVDVIAYSDVLPVIA
jgi:hypothetical protein